MLIHPFIYWFAHIINDKMGRINIIIPDDLENKLRREIAKRFGLRKGNIQRAMEEAIGMWIKKGDR